MNYFAHGLRFLDRPYFLAGTAVPDWLSVVDRKVRMRSRNVRPFLQPDSEADDEPDEIQAEVAAGVLQHLHDDQWFHDTRGFLEITAEIGRRYRAVLDVDDGFRAGFLGHITAELLLDADLIERFPGRIDTYYEQLSKLDVESIETSVNRMARNTTDQLGRFISIFLEVQFLRDYLDSGRLLYRLNQVMRRIKLHPLPDAAQEVLDFGRELVHDRAEELLPEELFVPESVDQRQDLTD